MSYELMNAHPITMAIVMASMLVTPLYVFATYVYSDASRTKGMIIAVSFLLFGTTMFIVCISDVPRSLGLTGNLMIPIAWTTPSLILYLWRDWFLELPLSQKWLIGLQLFRVIGGVFLIEMMRHNIPGIFAYPAGIGDISVGLIALVVLLGSCNQPSPSARSIKVVAVIGVLDFISAFFFGFGSSESSVQIFDPEITNNTILFPTGLIPLFLVPYAIFFHTLSILNYRKFGVDQARRSPRQHRKK